MTPSSHLTPTEIARHRKTIRRLKPPTQRGTPTEPLWLLLPVGMPQDALIMAQVARLGCNGVVTPTHAWGTTPLHLAAKAAGLDVSHPILYREPPPPPPPPPPDPAELLAELKRKVAELEALVAASPHR